MKLKERKKKKGRNIFENILFILLATISTEWHFTFFGITSKTSIFVKFQCLFSFVSLGNSKIFPSHLGKRNKFYSASVCVWYVCVCTCSVVCCVSVYFFFFFFEEVCLKSHGKMYIKRFDN